MLRILTRLTRYVAGKGPVPPVGPDDKQGGQQQLYVESLKKQKQEESAGSKRAVFYIIIISLVGIQGLNYTLARLQRNIEIKTEEAQIIPQELIHWTFLDSNKQEFGSKQMLGFYYLISFGYSGCKGSCAITQAKISGILRRLKQIPEGKYIKLKTVFVSIDPQQSPQSLNSFLKIVSPETQGLFSACPQQDGLYRVLGLRPFQSLQHQPGVWLIDDRGSLVGRVDVCSSEALSRISGLIFERQRNKLRLLKRIK